MGEQPIAKKYRRRFGTSEVEAIHIALGSDLQAIAQWCGGEVVRWNAGQAVKLHTGQAGHKISYATLSDVISRSSSGTYSVYNGWHFSDQFRAVTDHG